MGTLLNSGSGDSRVVSLHRILALSFYPGSSAGDPGHDLIPVVRPFSGEATVGSWKKWPTV